MTSSDTEQEEITWVRVMCDHCADPVWGRDGVMLDVDDIEMSPRLKGRLREWADRFEELSARAEHGATPGLTREWKAFAMQGRHVAASLKDERPELTVIYFDQFRLTGCRDQDRGEFEFEITTEMAERLFSETDWPDGDYMNFRCDYCRSPFIGPKRQRHCMACDEAFVKPAALLERSAARGGMRPVSDPPDDGRNVFVVVSGDAAARRPDLAHIAGKVMIGRRQCENENIWSITGIYGEVQVGSEDLKGWAELNEGVSM